MLLPTKHENLQRNILVLGADVVAQMKSGTDNVEELFQYMKIHKDVSLEEIYDVVLFLWMCNVISVNQHRVTLTRICS